MASTPTALGDEQRTEAFAALVQRLSKQSVQKHFDAYEDIDWDDPEMAISADDPRSAVFQFDGLGATEWYQRQSPEVQGRIGLHRTAYGMRVGMQFENILQRGLLAFAYRLPNGAPEFRYIHHEVAEESQHSMMFQEVVNRSGVEVDGMPLALRFLAAVLIPPVQLLDPPLFFVFVLGGEEPIDHLQRRQLRGTPTHPLVERILRIHVTEEARHVSFARQYLRTEVPKLGRLRRAHLSIATPIVLGVMTPLMVNPPAQLTRAGVPRSVIREAVRSEEGKALRVDSVRKIRRFCRDLGLMNPAARAVWKLVGLWDDDAAAPTRDAPDGG
jgi:hypothetical protein